MGSSIDKFGVELPKKIDILRRYYALKRNLSESQKITQIIHEIKEVYQNSDIATVHIENIRLKLKSLIKTSKSIISTRKSQSENQKQKEFDFRSNINSLFEISAAAPTQYSGTQVFDEPLLMRNLTDINMDTNELQQGYDNFDVQQHNETIGDEYVPNKESSDEEFEPPQKRQKLSPDMLKKINSECSQNASYRLMSSFIKIGIEIAGGNPQGYCVSKSQLQNQLTKFRSAEKLNKFEQLVNSDSKLILQFDTKSCSKLNKRHLGLKIRLVVILRSESNVVTLGSFMVSGHGAVVCATEITDVITTYNLSNRIIGIVCDTENTNTGRISGVCIRIEEFLEKSLLNFMCRHHIYDLILKHVGLFLFGHSTGPTFDFGCTELKNAWEHLNLSQFSPYNEEEFEDSHINCFREEAVRILKMQREKHQIRDDYAELTDLALKFFGESNLETKRFMVPGAVNNSRWMARAIYVIKCYLFRSQIDLSDHLLDSLRRFALFISSIYVKYWNWCSDVFNAPVNDLRFLKELEKYREVDADIANVAIEQFCNHLTYLSDEMVILSIFSNQLNGDEKEKIQSKLNQTVGPRTANSIRYKHEEGFFSSLELQDFITDRSMFLLSCLDIDLSFVEHNANEWETLESYQYARQMLKKLLVVVNDSSERALGQTANAINHQKARTEQNLQNYLICKLSN